MTDTNTITLNQIPYETEGKTLFTETLERICEQFEDAFRTFGQEWDND